MADVGIGIDLGPGSGVNARFGIDPQRPYRMHLRTGFGGCLRIVGLILIAIAGAMQASTFAETQHGWILLASIMIGTVAAILMFGTAEIVLDRRDSVLAIKERLLLFKGDTTYIEVETDPQVYVQKDVELGLSDGIIVEVLSELDTALNIKIPNARIETK